MASGKLIDYLGYGTHAARAATPPVGTGVSAIYRETDTGHSFQWDGSAWIQIDGGLSNPMTTQDDIIVGGASGVPARLGKGSDGQVLTVDPTTHHLVWATPAAGGGTTSLLAAVPGTDGATSAANANYVAFSTAWITGSLVTTATQDMIITVTVSFTDANNGAADFGLFRSGTLIFNTRTLYNGLNVSTNGATYSFTWVDKALAAGTYTYEVRYGSFNANTCTLSNAVVTTPTATSKGGSMLTVSSAANV